MPIERPTQQHLDRRLTADGQLLRLGERVRRGLDFPHIFNSYDHRRLTILKPDECSYSAISSWSDLARYFSIVTNAGAGLDKA